VLQIDNDDDFFAPYKLSQELHDPARICVFDRRGGVLSDRTVRAVLSEFARLSVSMRSGNRDE